MGYETEENEVDSFGSRVRRWKISFSFCEFETLVSYFAIKISKRDILVFGFMCLYFRSYSSVTGKYLGFIGLVIKIKDSWADKINQG